MEDALEQLSIRRVNIEKAAAILRERLNLKGSPSVQMVVDYIMNQRSSSFQDQEPYSHPKGEARAFHKERLDPAPFNTFYENHFELNKFQDWGEPFQVEFFLESKQVCEKVVSHFRGEPLYCPNYNAIAIYYRPRDIFVMTTKTAYNYVDWCVDRGFSRKIARRLYDEKDMMECSVDPEKKGAFYYNYRIRGDSSVYDLPIFPENILNAPKGVSLEIRTASIKFNLQSLSKTLYLPIFHHLSLICYNEPTWVWGTRWGPSPIQEVDLDEDCFSTCFTYCDNETQSHMSSSLNRILFGIDYYLSTLLRLNLHILAPQFREQQMELQEEEDLKVNFTFKCPWHSYERILLLHKHRTIQTYDNGIPQLSQILEDIIKDKISFNDLEQFRVLKSHSIQTEDSHRLIYCIEGYVEDFEASTLYKLTKGKWWERNMKDFERKTARDFNRLVGSNCKIDEKELELHKYFSPAQVVEIQQIYEELTGTTQRKVEEEDGVIVMEQDGREPFNNSSTAGVKRADNILQIPLEGIYNFGHVNLNDVLLGDSSDSLYRGVELFDLLRVVQHGEEKQLYLYHVKRKFNREIRTACSQIQCSYEVLCNLNEKTFSAILDKLKANPRNAKILKENGLLDPATFRALFRRAVFILAFVDEQGSVFDEIHSENSKNTRIGLSANGLPTITLSQILEKYKKTTARAMRNFSILLGRDTVTVAELEAEVQKLLKQNGYVTAEGLPAAKMRNEKLKLIADYNAGSLPQVQTLIANGKEQQPQNIYHIKMGFLKCVTLLVNLWFPSPRYTTTLIPQLEVLKTRAVLKDQFRILKIVVDDGPGFREDALALVQNYFKSLRK